MWRHHAYDLTTWVTPPAPSARVSQCNHDVAEYNLVVRLVKDPAVEWNSFPALTAQEVAARKKREAIQRFVDCSRSHTAQDDADSGSAPSAAAAAASVAELPGGLDKGARVGSAVEALAAGGVGGHLAPGHGGLGSTGVGGGGGAKPGFVRLAYELD